MDSRIITRLHNKMIGDVEKRYGVHGVHGVHGNGDYGVLHAIAQVPSIADVHCVGAATVVQRAARQIALRLIAIGLSVA